MALVRCVVAVLGALAVIWPPRGVAQTVRSQKHAPAVSAGHGYRPVTHAAEFTTPMLILHGTADGPADGGGVNTQVALARDFEAALRQNGKAVEAHYYEGGGHNTFFTSAAQHDDELKTMIAFLRRHLGA